MERSRERKKIYNILIVIDFLANRYSKALLSLFDLKIYRSLGLTKRPEICDESACSVA